MKTAWQAAPLSDVLTDAKSGFACGENPAEGMFQFRMNNITTDGRLDFSKKRRVPRDTRSQATYWLGQEAADAAAAGLKEIIASDDDVQVRNQAVFALSQRPNDESVPALITLIRSRDTDPRIKKQALFWLGQKDDDRALALIEEILTRK